MRLKVMRVVIAVVVSLGCAGILGAQTPPSGGSEKGGGAPGSGETPQQVPQLDAVGKDLAAKTDALAKQAQALVDAYKAQLKAKVEKLASQDPTLKRLNGAGIFTLDALLAGVESEPLAALPGVRTA